MSIPRFVLCAAVILLAAPVLRAEVPATQSAGPIRYEHLVRAVPVLSEYIVTVDLTDPKVSVRVCPGGDDPDGPGPWETTLMPVKKIAEREKLDVAVNASYFHIPSTRPIAEEQAEKAGTPSIISANASGYVEGRWANDSGVTIADGRHWGVTANPHWPTIWVIAKNKVEMGPGDKVPADATAAVSGNVFVLQKGEVVPEKANATQRHPRTVVGLDEPGKKLVILVVDGRQLSSIGMTGTDMGNEMKRLGCYTAINLDGGGSTTMVMREEDSGNYKVLNRPSDGHERPVADVLGVSVHD